MYRLKSFVNEVNNLEFEEVYETEEDAIHSLEIMAHSARLCGINNKWQVNKITENVSCHTLYISTNHMFIIYLIKE